MTQGDFCWYELATTDPVAAATFYADVVGWRMADAGAPGMPYTLGHVGDRQTVGLMAYPPEVTLPYPVWFGYIAVDDVDAMAAKVIQAGGQVRREPMDIPGIGRFAVCGDPQGAAFMLFKSQGEPAPELSGEEPGAIGWHELHAKDADALFPFYADLFGWTKGDGMDMGPMGTYQLLHTGGGKRDAAIFNSPAPNTAFWAYYFRVDDIDVAQTRATDRGATVLFGPQEVPEGLWVVNAVDPQGGHFSMVGPRAG